MSNNNNKFNGRKSWMSQQRERFGSEFLNTVRLDSLNNNLGKILEDIADGRVERDKDFTTIGFFHPTFVGSMKKFCEHRYIYFGQMYYAFSCAINTNQSLARDSNYMMRINMYAAQYSFYYEMTQLWASVEQSVLLKTYDETLLHQIQTKIASFYNQNPISMERLFTPRENV